MFNLQVSKCFPSHSVFVGIVLFFLGKKRAAGLAAQAGFVVLLLYRLYPVQLTRSTLSHCPAVWVKARVGAGTLAFAHSYSQV